MEGRYFPKTQRVQGQENEDAGGSFGKREGGREEVNRSHITRGEEHGNSEPTFRHTAAIIIVVVRHSSSVRPGA